MLGAGFSQFDLPNFMVSTERRIDECASMAELLALGVVLIKFASAASARNARALKLAALAFTFRVVEADQPSENG